MAFAGEMTLTASDTFLGYCPHSKHIDAIGIGPYDAQLVEGLSKHV